MDGVVLHDDVYSQNFTAAHASPPRHITLSEARSRLYQRRFWHPNSHFSAFSEIYKIFIILRCSNPKILQIFINMFMILLKFSQNFRKNPDFSKNVDKFQQKIQEFSQNLEFRAVQKCANLLDLEKC